MLGGGTPHVVGIFRVEENEEEGGGKEERRERERAVQGEVGEAGNGVM